MQTIYKGKSYLAIWNLHYSRFDIASICSLSIS